MILQRSMKDGTRKIISLSGPVLGIKMYPLNRLSKRSYELGKEFEIIKNSVFFENKVSIINILL